jgi:hypothetical protein
MDATKIRLSPEEAALVLNPGWILTKNRIITKVKNLLEQIQEEEQNYVVAHSSLPAEVTSIPPKISKGENYKGLPYVILDFPRCFNKEDVFAIRTMFWWGHFFSITLQLSGKYKSINAQSFDILIKNGYFICINDDPWEHHFEAGNYVAVESLSPKQFEDIIQSHPFIKLAKKIQLSEWDNVQDDTIETFRQLLSLCSNK